MYVAVGDSLGWRDISDPRPVHTAKILSGPFGFDLGRFYWTAKRSVTISWVYVLDERYVTAKRLPLKSAVSVAKGSEFELDNVTFTIENSPGHASLGPALT